MQFDDKQVLEDYMAEIKDISGEFYKSLCRCIEISKGTDQGARVAKYIILQVLASAKIEILEKEFYRVVEQCAGVHSVYATELEQFKQAMWGRYLDFSAVVDSKNSKYTALYKSAMALKKEYIGLCNDHIKYAIMVLRYNPAGNILGKQYVLPSDMSFKDDENTKFANKTNAEAIGIDKQRHNDNIAKMETALAKTRTNLRSDIDKSNVAKMAVQASERADYSDKA